MVKRNINIEYLVIWRNINNIASQVEKDELQKWLDEDKKHYLLYEHLKNSSNNELVFNEAHVYKKWLLLNERIEKRPVSIKRWLQYVAAIILPLGIALSVLYFSNKEVQSIEMAHQISPGSSRAVLKLANGEALELDANYKMTIKDEQGQVIGIDSLDVLTYNNNSQQTTFNTINIPRGGEYQLVLSDGTKVWLNSESSLTYPVSFNSHLREVFLTGEAYFDVTTNKEKPFIVNTATADVKVYGTQFNVMSYDSDKVTETTLVEGSVAVLIDGQETRIKPGQQAQVSSLNSKVVVRQVDTRLYTDWRNGIFRFEEMALKDVAVKLARWYNVEFFFANEEIKERKITGAMKRATDFNLFLSLIEKSAEAEITINDNNVLIKGKY